MEIVGEYDQEFTIELEKIAKYLKIDLFKLADYVIDEYKKNKNGFGKYSKLCPVAQERLLIEIEDKLENDGYKVVIDVSNILYPSLKVNDVYIKSLNDLKKIVE